MPFTFAHPAIVLPLNKIGKRWVSLTGLVIGSIVPDFEYFLRLKVLSLKSHTLSGLFYFDLNVGVLLFVIYNNLVKETLVAHLPQWLNRRFCLCRSSPQITSRYVLIVYVSILAGSASHLLWDSFTHPGGYFVNQLQLAQSVVIGNHYVPVYKILQHGSTLVGFIAIALCVKSLPKKECPQSKPVIIYWIIVAGIAGLLLIAKMMVCFPFPG